MSKLFAVLDICVKCTKEINMKEMNCRCQSDKSCLVPTWWLSFIFSLDKTVFWIETCHYAEPLSHHHFIRIMHLGIDKKVGPQNQEPLLSDHGAKVKKYHQRCQKELHLSHPDRPKQDPSESMAWIKQEKMGVYLVFSLQAVIVAFLLTESRVRI